MSAALQQYIDSIADRVTRTGEEPIQMIVMNKTMPEDLQRRVDDGRLTEAAAIKIAQGRAVEEVLWELARRAGIAQDLEAMLV